ncbi:molybdopterin adenylyltransferase [Candidatus Methylacidithermus pantelleriae]|uniref:Molybdopterin adenylyltransferase n=1 Tax=Candidatus Methylacidithermus pantelleriae TaxID=2744239 RepID=A0A8J2FRM0_9BACT|nr:molybdopterin adenylyltransferase [Candidatus Methylacidithermus pantelleriae]CAF0689405.1 Molybdopterin adenylyltransferase [Candidatus Methylacidithermus pantelleriae]
MKVGRITLSDRASAGVYEDQSGPEIEKVLAELFQEPLEFLALVLPDERSLLEEALCRLADVEGCPLIVTTGGTGPSQRDVTPEATRAVIEKELPGFGEIMRWHSYQEVKTAILSRATAGIRGQSLIINLPGSPRSIRHCLKLLGPAMSEAIEHLTGWRPKLRS